MSDTARAAGALSIAIHTSDEARKRLAGRYGAERRFKAYGAIAILIAAGALVLLLSTVVGQGIQAFTVHRLTLPLDLSYEKVDPKKTGDPEVLRKADYRGIVRDGLKELFPWVKSRGDRKILYGVVSSGAGVLLGREVDDDLSIVSAKKDHSVLMSDTADHYLKGLVTKTATVDSRGIASPTGTEGDIKVLSTANDFAAILAEIKQLLADHAAGVRDEIEGRERSVRRFNARIENLAGRIANEPAGSATRTRLESEKSARERDLAAAKAQIASLTREAEAFETRARAVNEREQMNTALPSYIIKINGGAVKVVAVDDTGVEGRVLVPLKSTDDAAEGSWSIEKILVPESSRKVDDREIVWLDRLKADGRVENTFNTTFFSSGASREPEMAGIWGAVVGSFFTMLVTLSLAFPLGVAAAIYLEEFAPKNRWTHLIEVNINNLAAVPSIVFGLLGLAVFLNVFGMPRSAPVVGGMVLALMTLPTIIIAARAALKAVPPSIREAALGIGASRIQTVFHHVLPLAMPGILTGTIIGMAQALGETAPLLMIGMVAFIVDIPSSPVDPSTVLPVQIYMWADFPEPAFRQKTAAAIMVLLGFLILMNALAVVLRKRFERRW